MTVRVLVVYGSQTGNSEKVIKMIAKKWEANEGLKFKVENIIEGNEVDDDMWDGMKDRFDVILVCTSSYGEGDPPDNYGHFLVKLIHGAQSGAKPLTGMQHAVLGEGSSVYEDTFQNNPRLTDKLLEECGSRRLARRHEIDVGGEEDESVGRNLFSQAVFEALQALPSAHSPPAADWAEPRVSHKEPVTRLTEKTEQGILGGGSKLKGLFIPVIALIGVTCGLFYTYFIENQ